jgi:ATP-binding cassette, subfamily B, multidrug efflux pump
VASPLLDPNLDSDREPRVPARQLVGRLLPYYARFRRQLILAVVLLLGTIGLGLLAPLFLGQLIDLATRGAVEADRPLAIPVEANRAGVLILAGLFVGSVILSFLLEACLGFVMARVGVSMVLQLKDDLFRKTLSLDPDFFRDYTPGRLIARVESDTETLKNLFASTTLQLLRASLTFVGILACMAAFDAYTTRTILPVLLGIALSTALFLRLVRRYYVRSRRLLASQTAHIAEYVQGIEVVQHYGYEPVAEARLAEFQRQRARADNTASFLSYTFWGFFAACEAATAGLVIWIGVSRVVDGTLTLGTLVVFLEYLRQVFMPIQMLSEFVSQIQQGMVSAGRIFGILAREPRVRDRAPADGGPQADVELTEAVRFEDVRFSYDETREVLGGVSFDLPRGSRVALVGHSGGGKTTLVSLLLRFYDPSAGRITVDGVDLRHLARGAWRRRVGLVLQDVYLFPGSLRDNLTVFDDSRDAAAVEAACRTVGAERLLTGLPGGLEGELHERGRNLSHGERQLVSLARALVHDPQLLVLDEATSSVDPATEARIQASLDRLMEGRTALIVAHRLSTIRACDQILVVDDGLIVERGTHDELWERDGTYRALARLQFPELVSGEVAS